MENSNLIPVKIPKGILLLTKKEFIEGIKRGKAYLRKQSLEKRLKNDERKPNNK